jgi:hypothetical protein
MFRILLGPALPIAALGAAAALIVPNVWERSGDAMLVAAASPAPAAIQPVRASEEDCALTLLATGADSNLLTTPGSGTQVAATALPSPSGETTVAIEATPAGSNGPNSSYVIVFDASGNIVAAQSAPALGLTSASHALDCSPSHSGPV